MGSIAWPVFDFVLPARRPSVGKATPNSSLDRSDAAATSRPAIAGGGTARLRGGRGVGLDDLSATATELCVRGGPPRPARATDGPPPPLSWGRIKLSRSQSAIFLPSRQINRFKISPQTNAGPLLFFPLPP